MILKGFVVCIVSLIALNVYVNPLFVIESIEYVVKGMIEYLNELDIYLEEKQKELKYENVFDRSCPKHSYRIKVIHRKPLIIYIENLVTENEINHLIDLTKSSFKASMISSDEKGMDSVQDSRTSTSAYINRRQTRLVQCLHQRFAQFQGNIDVQRMEPFQVVKYIDHQRYDFHYDWFVENKDLQNGGQRVSTFFTYLRSNCSNGETEFVDIPFNRTLHKQFCHFLNCDRNASQHGIRFRPIEGNSIFWYNLDENGQVDQLTMHAGHPPGPNSFKIGLNTWTRTHLFHWPGDQ